MSTYTTYSFKDLSGAFYHPLAGVYTFGGTIGLGQAVVHMATEKTVHEVASDGTVQVSAVAGDNGTIAIECQMTSSLNGFLYKWFNTIKNNLNNGDISNWVSASLLLRNTLNGTSHICTGISPQNIPDKTYTKQGGNVTWTLMCSDIQNPTI
jgi:hypothetical protein